MPSSSAAPDAGTDVDSGTGVINQQERIEKLQNLLKQDVVLDYLGMEHDKIGEMLKSAEKREELCKRLHPILGMEQEQLQRDLDALAEYLELQVEMASAHERFLSDVQSPEKAGIFRTAFEKVKNFASNHKATIALLAIVAALVGGYFAWNYLGTLIPIPNPMEGAAGVADAIAAPAGGAFEAIPQGDIVPPNLFPGSVAPDLPLPPMPTGTPADFFPSGMPQ